MLRIDLYSISRLFLDVDVQTLVSTLKLRWDNRLPSNAAVASRRAQTGELRRLELCHRQARRNALANCLIVQLEGFGVHSVCIIISNHNLLHLIYAILTYENS